MKFVFNDYTYDDIFLEKLNDSLNDICAFSYNKFLNAKFNDFSLHINSLWSKFNELNFKYMSRKEQAIHIKSIFGKHSGIGFAFLDGKINTIQEHLKKCPIKNLIIMLGLSK
jgi:hypothetical protein